MKRIGVLGAAAVAFALLIPSAASAQVLTHLYPVKVVCGFKEGNIPPLSSTPGNPPRAYEDLKPGNYATTVNIFNSERASNRLESYVQIPGDRLTLFRTWDALSFESQEYSCPNIASVLGLTSGAVFDAWLLLFATSDDFEVAPVYTFESQNGFYDTQLWEVGPGSVAPLGPYSPNWFNPVITGPNFPPNMAPWPVFVTGGQGTVAPSNQVAQRHVVAAGRGGLGLGASIDVERVEPRRLDEALSSDELAAMSR